MKRLTATALGWLVKKNPVAHYFYTLTAALEEERDPRAEQVRALMREDERETVREAYGRSE